MFKRTIFITAIVIGNLLIANSQVDTISNNIYQRNGNLSIGDINPPVLLNVQGSFASGIERNLLRLNNTYDGSSAYTGIMLTNGNNSSASVIQNYSLNYSASPAYDFAGFLNISNNGKGVMIHANSADGIVKFYTGYDENAGAGIERLRIDQNGHVGIGTPEPQNALSIVGNETEWPGRVLLSVINTNTSGKSLAYMELKAGSSGNHLILGHISETYTGNSRPEDLQDYGLLTSNGKGLLIGALKNDLSAGVIKFFNGQNPDNSFIETMRIAENGNVGIGTSEPQAKLQVADGDVYISDIDKGIIMKSPNGNCWRGVVNNSGKLVFSSVDCPGEPVAPEVLIEQKTTTSAIQIYPNPSNGCIYIDSEKYLGNETLQYEIINLDGKIVLGSKIASSISKIDITSLLIGTFVIVVKNGSGVTINSQKIVKE